MSERLEITVDGVRLACHARGPADAPALVIAGGPTSHIPQDKLAEAAARLPHGTLQVIPAGHEVHANRPAEFTAAVLQFLRC